MEFENNAFFWQKIDTLYLSSDLVIDRPKNTHHPEYDNLVYPVNYGYLKDDANTEKINVYKGTNFNQGVQALVVCADILKKDIEVKLIVDCNKEEVDAILEFLNQTDFQKSIIIRRGNNIPSWAVKE